MDIRVITFSTAILIFVISFFFYQRQNSGNTIGGKIAVSKLFWLDYTLIAWFFTPPIIYFFSKSNLKTALLGLTLSMWTRGIIELYLLFVTKKWKPIYGIVHNVFTLILFTLLLFFSLPIDKASYFYSISLFISLILETYYAYFFKVKIGKKTQGEDAIWFASKENPIFKEVLTITTIGNLIVYPIMFIFFFKLN